MYILCFSTVYMGRLAWNKPDWLIDFVDFIDGVLFCIIFMPVLVEFACRYAQAGIG